MRYYIINSDGKEVAFDVASIETTRAGVVGLNVATPEKTSKQFFVKSLANNHYISEDEVKWQKIPKISSAQGLVNVTEALKVYRGFKPSGLFGANAGALVTDMPGKIAKVMTQEGATVSKGDTLLILEAMKMENEIKAGVDGIVKTVHVKEGQTVETGFLMIEIDE